MADNASGSKNTAKSNSKAKGKRRPKMECPFNNYDELVQFLFEPLIPKLEQYFEDRMACLLAILYDLGGLDYVMRACKDKAYRREQMEKYKEQIFATMKAHYEQKKALANSKDTA